MTRHPPALIAAIGAALVAATLSTSPAVAGNVAWSVSIGGPGFAVSAGQPGFVGAPWSAGAWRPLRRPAIVPFVAVPPVVVSPWLAPVAAPAPVFVPRPVVVRPAAVPVAPRRMVVAPWPRVVMR